MLEFKTLLWEPRLPERALGRCHRKCLVRVGRFYTRGDLIHMPKIPGSLRFKNKRLAKKFFTHNVVAPYHNLATFKDSSDE